MEGLPLEPGGSDFRTLTHDALDRLVAVTESRKDAPATDYTDVDALLTRVRQPIPEMGARYSDVLDLVLAACSKGFDTTGDGFLAYVPGGGLLTAALADFIALVTNRFATMSAAAPVVAQIEAAALRWLSDILGYPDEARGVLTTGGSLAHFSALVTAREALVGEDVALGTIYVTSQTHDALAKSAGLAGFPRDNLRVVDTTDTLAMDVAALNARMSSDRSAGLRPCVVVATAGTTNTGAVDNIAALADATAAAGAWLHIDAAYGGFFQLTERGRRRFAGIERSDSVVLDPHKGLFLPYGTGALLVRDGRRLRDAHEVRGDYLQDHPPDGAIPNFAMYSPELSREARGLRLWMPLMLHGVAAFRDALEEKLDLARYVYDEIRRIPELEVPWEPELSTVCFRCAPGQWADPDGATRSLLAAVNESRRVLLSSTVVAGRYTIRVCILSVHTHRDRIDELLGLIRSAISSLTTSLHSAATT